MFKNNLIRKLILLGTPLCLGLLEIGHQSHMGISMYNSLSPIANWWLILHLIQLPLFGLLALAVYMLGNDLHGKLLILNRIGLTLFIVFYMAMDAIQGIATGFIISYSNTLPLNQQLIIGNSINALWASPLLGTISVISVVGTLGWIISVLAIAFSLYQKRLYVLAILFALAAVIFGITHAFPFGPIGMGFFFIAVLLYERVPKRKLI